MLITTNNYFYRSLRLSLYIFVPCFIVSHHLADGVSEKFISKIESSIPTDILKINSNKLVIEKDLTIIVYLAGVNNLGYFLRKNLNQLAEIGSHKFCNIIVHLDALLPGNKKVTKRYFVEKNKLVILNQNDPATQSMDSGDPNSLISLCNFCVENYRAKHYMLVMSNHATGILDIGQARAVNPSQLFTFNPTTNMIELNRAVPFLEYITSPDNQRGICFDDITGHYLTNHQLDMALKTICTKIIKNKFETILFDACLQQMYEIGAILKPYAKIMLGSQEVILAPGLDYEDVLRPFENKKIDTLVFAKHIVASYENTYKKITHDYTFSALDLTMMQMLENNINATASLLIEGIKLTRNNFIKEAIKTSRHKLLCTHFEEPSYIDLHHFYTNLLNNLSRFNLQPNNHDEQLKSLINKIAQHIKEGLTLIKKVILANVAGKNLSQAKGLSIYFPEYGQKHPSYNYNHAWSQFLDHYLHA